LLFIKQKRKVRLYIQDGPTIEGVLAGRTRNDYILWAPKIVQGDPDPVVEVSGHVEIERSKVLWTQVIG